MRRPCWFVCMYEAVVKVKELACATRWLSYRVVAARRGYEMTNGFVIPGEEDDDDYDDDDDDEQRVAPPAIRSGLAGEPQLWACLPSLSLSRKLLLFAGLHLCWPLASTSTFCIV